MQPDFLIKHEDMKYLAVPLPLDVDSYRLNGDFDNEIRCISRKLKNPALSHSLRMRLMLELIIASGMKTDYTTTYEELLERICSNTPNMTKDILDKIIDTGNVDFILKNGVPYFQNSAYANIIATHSRLLNSIDTGSYDNSPIFNLRRHENVKIMKEKGYRAFRYTVYHEIKPKDDERFTDGKSIAVYFPYPAICDEMIDVEFISSSDPVFISDASHRTACIKAVYQKGAVYGITYAFTCKSVYKKIETDKISSKQPSFYTDEMYPHIVFTPYLKFLAAEIVGDETNPYLKARAVYNWITENVKYSYMRNYLYIDNIPAFAALNRRGDCGVQALLFITLCRILGIPAKWQSGSHVTPDSIGSHDWAQFYIAPYGWLYADPSFGGGALRNKDCLLHEHYFGNLDPNRLVACNDFMQPFNPPKRYLRNDPYDNQSGEAEFYDLPLLCGDFSSNRKIIAAEEITF